MEAPPSSYSLSPASQSSITFYDFLDKMRNPASLDLVRAIKSFIVSFSFYTANPENDGKRVQEFFSTMEATIIEHPLWAGATNEEVDCAMEGLEKYVMTKLFSRTFTASPEDVKIDREIFEKIQLLQTFLRPEHLDIPKFLQNEASWLLAEKELQKINAFKAPREKLLCIMSCCRVINNLLLNASISENHALGGADDFLPVLIYVTIKANPPQLHSNLKFIQLYRRQAKLVSEAAYYFTNLVSAKSFIIDLNAKSLSMDEIEFEQSMQSARLANNKSQVEPSSISYGMTDLGAETGPGTSTSMDDVETNMNGTLHYPYMEAEAGELTVKDVERLLSLYKDVVTKYTSLCSAVRRISESGMVPSHPIFRGTSAFSSQVEGQPEGTDVSVDVKEEEQSRKQICK
ncbi:hypothetical protein P3X46_021974 [Hevea brasiliensis]|uniref:VPS9 domain-containing protein n=1 Tax=Hevea brasiliensis TaxID=3981 RepID=A0ABQ9LIK3_HEVBR|nr:vacuolar protein sorting-associated protein 9A isoform X2 [Hevea brasiliensis]KAJ9167310.1 hypothetical protein P3X46_021974 [Hevea brasiliensis]